MLNKLWCQKITRKWLHTKEEPPHPRLLSEPKCQKHVATWYLIYRWILFMVWTCIVVCAIFEIGSYNPMYAYDKWPIYLTNWHLVMGMIQAVLGGFLVSKRWKLQKISGFDPSTLTVGFIERIYWFLYVVTTNIAFGVTITYWFGIYDPKVHYLDILNLMQHVFNSILMIVDFCVTCVPFRLRNFWWCSTIVILYITFSLIYYLAGGLDKNGYHHIYKILDWKKPVQTSLLCIGEIIFVTAMFSLMCFLEKVKHRLYLKMDKKLGRPCAESQLSSAEKHADIV